MLGNSVAEEKASGTRCAGAHYTHFYVRGDATVDSQQPRLGENIETLQPPTRHAEGRLENPPGHACGNNNVKNYTILEVSYT